MLANFAFQVISGLLADILRSQNEIIEKKLLLFVNQLGSYAWTPIELILEVCSVHVVYPRHIVDEDVDGVLWQVSCDVLPYEAPLLGESDQPVAVEDLAKVAEVELLEALVGLEREGRRGRGPDLDEAVGCHGAVDAEGVGTLQRDRVHDRAVGLAERPATHAVEALHWEDVEVVADAVRLGNL